MLLLPKPSQELPLKNYKRALGCDPGKENFGWALYVRDVGVTHSGVIDGIDVVAYIPHYRKNLRRIYAIHNPDCMCIERFHSQPGRGSKQNLELVNLTIGIAIEVGLKRGIPVEFVTAAVHKGWLSKNFEVGLRKEKVRGKIKRKYDMTTFAEYKDLTTEHEVDAANMAKYALEHIFI